MPTDLAIVGAGGHASVVVEAIRSGDAEFCLQIVDQDKSKQGLDLLENTPITLFESWTGLASRIHVAIGDNSVRQRLIGKAIAHEKELVTVVHPSAQISVSASIGQGCFVAATTVVAAQAQVGSACILNHGSVIDHDCFVDSFSHIGPNATLGGEVHIGQGCLIGAGATLLPGIKVGNNSIVGAGSVVRFEVGDNQVVAGVPAKSIKAK